MATEPHPTPAADGSFGVGMPMDTEQVAVDPSQPDATKTDPAPDKATAGLLRELTQTRELLNAAKAKAAEAEAAKAESEKAAAERASQIEALTGRLTAAEERTAALRKHRIDRLPAEHAALLDGIPPELIDAKIEAVERLAQAAVPPARQPDAAARAGGAGGDPGALTEEEAAWAATIPWIGPKNSVASVKKAFKNRDKFTK